LADLLDDFGRYLKGDNVDSWPMASATGKIALELSDQKLTELAGRLNAALAPVIASRPGRGRRRRMFTTILMPTDTGGS